MPKLTPKRAFVLALLFASTAIALWWVVEGMKARELQAQARRTEVVKPPAVRPRTLEPARVAEASVTPDEPRPPAAPVAKASGAQTPRVPVAKESASKGGYVRLAAELVRRFPDLPEELKSRCARTDRGKSVEYLCRKGVDAPVHYVLAKDMTWATLAVLGPPGVNDREGCRKWLLAHAKDARPFGTRQKDDELQMYFVRSDARFLASFLTRTPLGAGAACSILACREDGRGNGEECRRPVD